MRRVAATGNASLNQSDELAWEALFRHLAPAKEGSVHWSLTVPDVTRWTAETPARHDLVVTLRAPDGTLAETATVRVGFRRVEIRGLDLLVNGQRIFIRGVNRHDFDQHTGRVVTADSMREDIVTMKRFGFNAVRTSHYPNDPAFLDLTDELGMYVIDEADIESHAFQSTLCDDPRYLSAWVERVAGWSCATRTIRRSSPGRSGTSPGTGAITRPPRHGSATTIRRGRSTTRAPSAGTGPATRRSAT